MEFANVDPRGFLAGYPEGAVLDEVQRCHSLFSYLQGIVDKKREAGLFVLTGSQQFGLISGIIQSIAGRVGILHLLPFSLTELKTGKIVPQSLDEMLFAGIKKWLKITDNVAKHPYIVYGGNEGQRRLGVEVLPWRDIGKVSAKV